MCRLTPEPDIGDGEDNSSIHVAVSSTYTDQQPGPLTLSVPSTGASRVPTPDPTPTRHSTRPSAVLKRGQDLESQPRRPPASPNPIRPPFDTSYVVDLVPRPETTSPASHGTKRMRSFEEIMNETPTPEKDKMTEAIEDMEKNLGTSNQVPVKELPRDNKRRKLPIRSSPRITNSNAEKASVASGVNDGSRAPSQKDGSQDSQSSQTPFGKT